VLLGVVHAGFTVADLDRSVAWYGDVLGLSLIRRQRNDNAYTRQIVGIEGAVLDVAFFGLPAGSRGASGQVLELMQYLEPPGGRPELHTGDVGVGHLALEVDDLAAEYERLRGHGVRFRNPPVEIDAGLNRGGWACYLLDPDGITIELIQAAGSHRSR
jgi:catechol 2,3-dioxygenase-like lactoylglutathione lyase family enzyme